MGTPAWLLNGNAGTNPANDFLGTSDSQDLIIKTSGTERIRVKASGKVGIGILDPAGFLSLGNYFGIRQLVWDGDLNNSQDANCGFGFDLVGPGSGLDIFMSPNYGLNIAAPTGPWPYPGYSAKLTILPNGNIGIGTRSPNFPLHLPPGKTLRIEGGTGAADAASYFSFGGNGTFGVDAPGVPNGRFAVLNSGNVGVGTPNPVASLDVANGLLHVGGTVNPAVTSQGAYLGWNALTGGTGETDFINNQGGGSGGFAFMNAPPSGNPLTTLLTIAGDGTVGIGTAPSSAARLTVLLADADILGLPTSAGVIGQVTNIQQIGFGRQTAGVRGINDEGHGVQGQSNSHIGTEGTSNSGTAVYAETQSGIGIWAVANSGPWAGLFQGNVSVSGTLSKPGGGFRIDHPADPANKYLNHSFVESSEMKNIYDGVAQMDANGEAIVDLADWMEELNQEFRIQLTPMGAPAPHLHLVGTIAHGRFRIAGGSPGHCVFWQVTGVRRDPWAKAHPLFVEEDKEECERGHYLQPELFGEPSTRNVFAARFRETVRA